MEQILEQLSAMHDQLRGAGSCQIVAAWKRKLVHSRKGAIWSCYRALGHHWWARVLPLISLSLITSQLFLPLSGSFSVSFHFYPHSSLTAFWLILLFLVPRYQLCNPASWRIYDLEFFRVANQELSSHSVSYLPESISQFLALDIYHFIASKALCEHEPASTNKNHSSASPYPVIVYQLLHFTEASLGSSFCLLLCRNIKTESEWR